MIVVKSLLALLWATVSAMPGILPTRVDYGWDGTPATQDQQASYIDYYAGWQTIAAGAGITDSGWIDFTNVGRPFCQCEIETLGTGTREIEVLIEYATWLNNRLLVINRRRQATVANVEYFPKSVIWNIDIDKKLGVIARVQWIYNRGDMNVNIQCLAPASGRPVADGVEVIDREVVENV